MAHPITQANYARRRHCSKAAVRKAVLAGRITLNADGLLDPEIADQQWLQNTVARVGSKPASRAADLPPKVPTPDDEPEDYQRSRARREEAEAGLAELELGEAQGRLLDRRRVETASFEAARWLRDQLGSCAGGMAAEVAGLAEAHSCEIVIRREHRQLLEVFVRQLGKMAGPPVETAPATEAGPAK